MFQTSCKWIIPNVLFCNLLRSFKIMFLRFIMRCSHVDICNSIHLNSFITYYSMNMPYLYILFYYWTFALFPIFTFMNNAAMKFLFMSLGAHVNELVSIYLEMKYWLLGHVHQGWDQTEASQVCGAQLSGGPHSQVLTYTRGSLRVYPSFSVMPWAPGLTHPCWPQEQTLSAFMNVTKLLLRMSEPI